ncbi:class I SAM-dependent methyltransferase [bacterium]|nr:class I SAM-dependent methyltransferase [bacterium]
MTFPNEQKIAESLDISVELLPFLPELLADIWILGSSPNHIFDMLLPLRLPADESRVLDVGCGKGAVSITLAQKFGLYIDAYDHFQPFLEEAKQKAEEYGVNKLCKFALADIRTILPSVRNYDIVIYAAVGAALGNLESCIGQLRQTVHPGGYILIDDGFSSAEKPLEFPGYEYVATREEARRQLLSHGDQLIQELLVPKNEIIAYNHQNNKVIQKRAAELIKRFPDKTKLFSQYVQHQLDECQVIENETQGAIWLLQRI